MSSRLFEVYRAQYNQQQSSTRPAEKMMVGAVRGAGLGGHYPALMSSLVMLLIAAACGDVPAQLGGGG
jgi:hypothetical protein